MLMIFHTKPLQEFGRGILNLLKTATLMYRKL